MSKKDSNGQPDMSPFAPADNPKTFVDMVDNSDRASIPHKSASELHDAAEQRARDEARITHPEDYE